eukprot:scpid102699/ scgid18972/ 
MLHMYMPMGRPCGTAGHKRMCTMIQPQFTFCFTRFRASQALAFLLLSRRGQITCAAKTTPGHDDQRHAVCPLTEAYCDRQCIIRGHWQVLCVALSGVSCAAITSQLLHGSSILHLCV